MRSVSVAVVFVVGYVLSAVAQNSTPATQVAPNLKPPWPERPATQVPPNPESSLSEELDKAAMRVLKELENPTTQAIPDPSAPISLDNSAAMQTLRSLAPGLIRQKTR